ALNRVANHLFLPQSTSIDSAVSQTARVLGASGSLLFYLTGVLALIVMLTAVAGLLRRGELFPRAMRLLVGLVGVVFFLLAAGAVGLGGLPVRYFLQLELCFGFLAAIVALSALSGGTRPRVKLGVFLCALPGVLQAIALVGERAGWLTSAGIVSIVAHGGELSLLVACIGAPVLLSPRPARERPWRRALAAAIVLTSALTVAIAVRYDLIQASLLYGLRLDLPRLGSALGVAYVAAFFCWTYATVQLLIDKGGTRLAGYGLALLAIAGYQAGSPVELELAFVGLLAVAVGELRAAPHAISEGARVGAEEWRAYIKRLATAAGDGTAPDDARSDAVIVAEGELEVTRISAHRRALPVSMRLLRRRGVLVDLEAVVGATPHGGPDASVERPHVRLARGADPRARLPRVKTGDAVFDLRLIVHGHAPLADAELRRRLMREAADGIVSLWRGTAARYAVAARSLDGATPPPFDGKLEGDAPVSAVVAVLDLLADLVDASASEASTTS
ncbi:MAG TPA: hypothetical protein VH560_08870, partial [Polyangia bacterium]|nr:hypothetical protein [Polyangia bacterium]